MSEFKKVNPDDAVYIECRKLGIDLVENLRQEAGISDTAIFGILWMAINYLQANNKELIPIIKKNFTEALEFLRKKPK